MASSANRTFTTAEARSRLSEVIDQARHGANRIVLTRHGKSVAAVVPIADLELLQEIERLLDVERAKIALAEAEERGVITLDRLKKELGLKTRAVRSGGRTKNALHGRSRARR
jgi:prevent-host-death family protein